MGRCTLRALALLLPAVLFVGCATGTQVTGSAFWVPAMSVLTNSDHLGTDARPDGPDLHSGSGFGARLGFQDGYQGFGILYLHTRHEEGPTDARMHSHSVVLEYLGTLGWHEEPPFIYGSMGAGVGGTVLDFNRHFDDTGGVTAMIRGEVGFALARFLRLHVGGGGYLWGYPGTTLGTGAFVTLGATLAF